MTLVSEGQFYLEKKKFQSSIGMTVLLISLGMLFASLFLCYAVLRSQATSWPPVEMARVPLWPPIVSSIILILLSLKQFTLEKRLRKLERKEVFSRFITVLVLGLIFLSLQSYFWFLLKTNGLYTSQGPFVSLIYGLTWIHAGHVFVGILFLIYLMPMVRKINEVKIEVFALRLKNIGKYWHFLGIVWFLIFILMFII